MPSPRRTPEPAGEPVASLEALSDVLRAQGWIARVTTWPREPACIVVQNPRDGAVSGRVLAVRDTLTGTWWYWFGRAEPLAPAGRAAAAAAVVDQVLVGSTWCPCRPGDPDGLARHAQPALPPRGSPARTGAGTGRAAARAGGDGRPGGGDDDGTGPGAGGATCRAGLPRAAGRWHARYPAAGGSDAGQRPAGGVQVRVADVAGWPAQPPGAPRVLGSPCG
jgi:hypothetical protein